MGICKLGCLENQTQGLSLLPIFRFSNQISRHLVSTHSSRRFKGQKILIFWVNILYNSTSSNFEKVKFSMAEIIERIFEKKHLNKITMFEDNLLFLKIGNGKVLESIFPKKISHYLCKSNHFLKISTERQYENFYFKKT